MRGSGGRSSERERAGGAFTGRRRGWVGHPGPLTRGRSGGFCPMGDGYVWRPWLGLYFERRVMNNPARARLIPYVAEAVRGPEETGVQSDGKIRHWRYVPELDTISV